MNARLVRVRTVRPVSTSIMGIPAFVLQAGRSVPTQPENSDSISFERRKKESDVVVFHAFFDTHTGTVL